MKAIYQWESGFDAGTNGALNSYNAAPSTANGGLGNQRDTFVGLSGGFGTVIAGRHDTPYKMAGSSDLFNGCLDRRCVVRDAITNCAFVFHIDGLFDARKTCVRFDGVALGRRHRQRVDFLPYRREALYRHSQQA